jgi:DNA replication and repair protein RecF
MHVRRVELRDFRNYDRLEVSLPAGMVIIHGPNGAGKSNLLEGICLATSGESPRARATEELVRVGCEHGFSGVRAVWEGREVMLEVGLARNGRRQIKINGAQRRRADLIGVAPVEYFSADDIEVVKGEPNGRRRLLDTVLCNTSRPYYFHLMRYRRAIEQRNQLLRHLRAGRGGEEALSPWDRAAARYGARVMAERADFLARLAPHAAAAHARLSGGPRPFLVEYRPSVALPDGQTEAREGKGRAHIVEELADSLERALREQRGEDLSRGVTQRGPHRDDLGLCLGGQAVRSYGSQGEQRRCALAIRLGSAAAEVGGGGRRPLLLLDDVLSELDEASRSGVFAACEECEQVVVTCCDLADIPKAVREEAAVFEVRDGRLA